MTAFITNTKSPKVKIVAGKVKKIRSGLIKVFNSDSTAATHIAVTTLVTSTDGNNLPITNTAIAVRSILIKVFILKVF